MLLILNGILGCGKIVEIPYLEIGSLVFDPLAKFIKRLLLDTLRKLSDRPTDTRLFGEATTGRGTIFPSQQILYPIAREGLARRASADEQLFVRGKTSHAPQRASRTPT